MAAAFRFAAKRLCGGALERPPQAFLTVAKELAGPTRNVPNRLGGTSLRRPFSSSAASSSPAAPNLHGNKAEPMTSLSARAMEKVQELQDLVRQMNRHQVLEFAKEVEKKRLLPVPDMLGELRFVNELIFIKNHAFKIVAGTLSATGALLYLEAKFIFPPLVAWLEHPPSSTRAE